MFKAHKWTIIAGPLLGLSLIVFIIPLPSFLIDALVVFQWFISVTLLLFVLANKQLKIISKLPSWLISITLVRLGINIVTTRSILLQAKAGGIIEQAGETLMGDRWTVGLVFFFGLLCVQYLVIAKGLERIAQLTARFNLEALPGAQQAILTQQNQGQLHSEKARRLRLLIEERSLRSSAIEGVLKFIKGEQLASLCLILINLFGGAWAGHYHDQLDFHQALTLYGKLAIGDGLLAQLPALYCSLATTIYITRLLTPNSENSLNSKSADLSTIVLSSSLALLFIGLLPIWTLESRWVIFSELSSIGLFLLFAKYTQNRQIIFESQSHSIIVKSKNSELTLVLSTEHSSSITGGIPQIVSKLNKRRSDLGLPERIINIQVRPTHLEQHRITLHLDNELIAFELVPPYHKFSLYKENVLPSTYHPYKGVMGVWLPQKESPPLLNELDFETWLNEWLIYNWCNQRALTWSVEEAWLWLNQGSPTLLEEALVYDQSILQLTDLLRTLSADGCSLNDINLVLEGLIRARHIHQDMSHLWLKELRLSLGIKALLGGYLVQELSVLWIEIPFGLKTGSFEKKAVLSKTLEEIVDTSESWAYHDNLIVIMIAEELRLMCQELSRQYLPGIKVLTPEEVPTRMKLKVVKVYGLSVHNA